MLFAKVWAKIVESPVIVLCTNEADSDQGIRAQILEREGARMVPASHWIQLRQLSDYSAKGIFHFTEGSFYICAYKARGFETFGVV